MLFLGSYELACGCFDNYEWYPFARYEILKSIKFILEGLARVAGHQVGALLVLSYTCWR